MQDPKSIIDEEKQHLKTETYAEYVLRSERTKVTPKLSGLYLETFSKGDMHLYSASTRTRMVDDDTFDEDTKFLLGLRTNDIRVAVETIINGLDLYFSLSDKYFPVGNKEERLAPSSEKISRSNKFNENLCNLALEAIAETKEKVRHANDNVLSNEPNFRGTLGAFFTVKVKCHTTNILKLIGKPKIATGEVTITFISTAIQLLDTDMCPCYPNRDPSLAPSIVSFREESIVFVR